MGKTIFAALLVSVLTSIVTTLIYSALESESRAAATEERRHADETAQIERERLDRRIADLEKRVAAAPRAERHAATAPEESPSVSAPGDPGAAPPAPLAPDGTPYVSKAELDRVLAGRAPVIANGEYKPMPKKSLEEIARDMNLSAGEEASLRDILRDAEQEFVHCLFGDRPYDDVKREVVAAKDDPDKAAVLLQNGIQNGLANAGKLMTLQNRTKKKVEAVLGTDRASKFLAAPRKPVIDPEFEELLRGKF
jgi:hypothetical protein